MDDLLKAVVAVAQLPDGLIRLRSLFVEAAVPLDQVNRIISQIPIPKPPTGYSEE